MSRPTVRLLTLNVGLLRLALLGRTVFEVPHTDARRAALGPALGRTGADVLCLQEVFRPADRDHLVAALAPTHPHVVRLDDRRRGLTHGLLLASRHPLRDAGFTSFRARHWWQRGVLRQGFLAATVELPGAGPVRVLDTHTTAGGRRDPQHAAVEHLRVRQLEQVRRAASGSGLPTLLCGDLNAGPQASAEPYEQLLAAGWSDPMAGHPGVTWDPRNALNRGGPFTGSPRQRIDHVLLDAAATRRFDVAAAGVVLDEPVVPTSGGLVTLSDHYGVLVDLVRAPGTHP